MVDGGDRRRPPDLVDLDRRQPGVLQRARAIRRRGRAARGGRGGSRATRPSGRPVDVALVEQGVVEPLEGRGRSVAVTGQVDRHPESLEVGRREPAVVRGRREMRVRCSPRPAPERLAPLDDALVAARARPCRRARSTRRGGALPPPRARRRGRSPPRAPASSIGGRWCAWWPVLPPHSVRPCVRCCQSSERSTRPTWPTSSWAAWRSCSAATRA